VGRLEPLRERLSAAERWEFDLARVRAYVGTGRLEQGLPVAQEMATSSAKDLDRQRTLATVLQSSSSAEAQKLARACWRRVEDGTPPGSPEWLIARAEVIRCFLALGERKDAQTLLTATKLLHPESDNAAIRQRFAALEKELRSAPVRK
jgi:hypothetical protein